MPWRNMLLRCGRFLEEDRPLVSDLEDYGKDKKALSSRFSAVVLRPVRRRSESKVTQIKQLFNIVPSRPAHLVTRFFLTAAVHSTVAHSPLPDFRDLERGELRIGDPSVSSPGVRSIANALSSDVSQILRCNALRNPTATMLGVTSAC